MPEDVSLVSFDDFTRANCFHPRLTAIAQPVLDRLSTPDAAHQLVRLNSQFVHRDSCGCNKNAVELL